jgi:hypothetical protein
MDFALSENAKTQYRVMNTSSCGRPAGDIQINVEYLTTNEPIAKAGVRLAHLLDIAFGNAG